MIQVHLTSNPCEVTQHKDTLLNCAPCPMPFPSLFSLVCFPLTLLALSLSLPHQIDLPRFLCCLPACLFVCGCFLAMEHGNEDGNGDAGADADVDADGACFLLVPS